ncbi:NAD(P)/FAD-dependent oxidoreductase [Myxococcota bacterium]|nr:NAD(P)/FAD-dependent oxidoreductase [Myxococcota bacterium]
MERVFDVIIVGAGLSGVGAARQIRSNCPEIQFCILESRKTMGGTWDLFRYPGIRSDSDMYTMAYESKPWNRPKAIADGASILNYIKEAALEDAIDQDIYFDHRVTSAKWSSENCTWTLGVENSRKEAEQSFSCRVLYICSGYFNYETGHNPELQNQSQFSGQIVHPQFWPSDLDYGEKTVTILGSGATAITLAPALAQNAKKVFLLQRSPSYILALPSFDPIGKFTNLILPKKLAHSLNRKRYISLQSFFYKRARKHPNQTKRFLLKLLRARLDSEYDIGEHFLPKYDPWDQRLCLAPDGDFFDAINSGKVEVITDEIETLTPEGIKLKSGPTFDTDIIITATGLKLKLLGGIEFYKDGDPIELSDTFSYKGLMFSNVPNLFSTMGYVNASWTLRSELASEFICRVLNKMKTLHANEVVPTLKDSSRLKAEKFFGENFSPGYIMRDLNLFPKQADVDPWRFIQNYKIDRKSIRRGPLEDGVLQFKSTPR